MNNFVNRIINKLLIIEHQYRIKISDFKIYIDYHQEFTFGKLLLSDLQLIRKYYNDEITYNKYLILKNRINESDVEVFYVKDKNSDILGYFCMSYKNIKENGINKTIKVIKDSVYLFDEYVFFKHRGKGVQRYAIINRLKEAVKMNKEYAIVNSYSWNIKSISNYKKIGFTKYKRYYYFKIIKKIIIIKE